MESSPADCVQTGFMLGTINTSPNPSEMCCVHYSIFNYHCRYLYILIAGIKFTKSFLNRTMKKKNLILHNFLHEVAYEWINLLKCEVYANPNSSDFNSYHYINAIQFLTTINLIVYYICFSFSKRLYQINCFDVALSQMYCFNLAFQKIPPGYLVILSQIHAHTVFLLILSVRVTTKQVPGRQYLPINFDQW